MASLGIKPTTMVGSISRLSYRNKRKLNQGFHYEFLMTTMKIIYRNWMFWKCSIHLTLLWRLCRISRAKLEHPSGMAVWQGWVQHGADCVRYRKDINHLRKKIRWQHPDRLTSSHIGLFLMLMQGWGPLKPGLFVPFTSTQKALDISIARLFFLTIIVRAAAHPSIPALQHKHGHHRSLHTHCDQRPVPKWSMTFK